MHISGFDLNLLLVLHALFEEGGVEAAAARIHLSRSAFSHALARAREALGEPIAVKVGRRLELPPRGQALREPVRQALTPGLTEFTVMWRGPSSLASTSTKYFGASLLAPYTAKPGSESTVVFEQMTMMRPPSRTRPLEAGAVGGAARPEPAAGFLPARGAVVPGRLARLHARARAGAARSALAGLDLSDVAEPAVAEHLAAGRLEEVLSDYVPGVPGFFLYFPHRAQRGPTLRALLEEMKRGL